MINRIKILTLMQLGNKIKVKNITNKKKFALSIFLFSLLALAITGVLFVVLSFIKNTLFLPVNKGMLTFLLFASQIISIITTTLSLSNSLYRSKDNPILLSYPTKSSEVFISKLLVVYLRELGKSLFFLLPLLIAYGILSNGSAVYFISSLFMFLILPIFPVCIGALLSIPFMYIKKLFTKFPFLYFILIIGMVVLVYFVLSSFVDSIPRPLRIIAIYSKFVNDITMFIVSANTYALFYVFITDIMFSLNILLNSLYLIGIIVGLLVLLYFVSLPTYFKLASSAEEHTKNNKIMKHKNKQNSVFLSFMKKELLLTKRNVDQIINNYILILIMPILLYAVNVVFSAIITSQLGDALIIAFNIIIGGLLILSSNTQSATAITTEGDAIAIMKTAPSNTAKMVWAKLFVNIFISTILILVSATILSFSNFINPEVVWNIFITLLFLNWGHILWSFQLDVVKPHLREYAETGRLDNNPNVNMCLIYALIIVLLMGFLSAFLFVDNFDTAWVKILLVSFGFFVFRAYVFFINLRVYFKRIEF